MVFAVVYIVLAGALYAASTEDDDLRFRTRATPIRERIITAAACLAWPLVLTVTTLHKILQALCIMLPASGVLMHLSKTFYVTAFDKASKARYWIRHCGNTAKDQHKEGSSL